MHAPALKAWARSLFSYKWRYIVLFGLVKMAFSTNSKPTIYINLYENTSLDVTVDGSFWIMLR